MGEQAPNLKIRPVLLGAAVRGLIQERRIATRPEDDRHVNVFVEKQSKLVRALCQTLRKVYDSSDVRDRMFRKASLQSYHTFPIKLR